MLFIFINKFLVVIFSLFFFLKIFSSIQLFYTNLWSLRKKEILVLLLNNNNKSWGLLELGWLCFNILYMSETKMRLRGLEKT